MNGRISSIAAGVVGLAGVLIPLILWWADQESKAISVDVVSKVALSPEMPDPASKVAVSIDGRLVDRAYVSLIELSNSGSQEVTAADYETPISIAISGASAVQARVVEKSPTDLNPSISLRNDILSISPLLLNSGDRIRLSIVSGGGAPAFSSSARIAGIRSIEVSDDTGSGNVFRAWRDGVNAVVLLALYSAMALAFAAYRTRELRRWALLVGAFACMFGVTAILRPYGVDSSRGGTSWRDLLLGLAIMTPFILSGLLLVKRRSR